MVATELSPQAVGAGGLTCTLEQSNITECKTLNRAILRTVDHHEKVAKYIRPRCKKWTCEFCANLNRESWAKHGMYGCTRLFADGCEISHVTITSHEENRKLEVAVPVWRDAWKKLSTRFRRAHPGAQYMYSGEQEAGEHFHIHMLTTATMPKKWYKDNARSCGLGYQCWVREVKSPAHGAWYITKYITKAMYGHEWPRYWRMVNCSRKWPKIPQIATSDVWRMITTETILADLDIQSFKKQGYRIEVL